MILKKIILISSCSMILAGCTDNGLLFRSNGEYEAKENIIYMIGDPFKVQEITYTPQENYTYNEEGLAGWYSLENDHSVTENGEHRDETQLTGMHKTLPLPSMVKVTNLTNNESVVVRVNDRGPFVNDRIIDVSEAAANILKLDKTKATPVKVEILAEESKKLKKELLDLETKEAMQNSALTVNVVSNDLETQETAEKTLDNSPKKQVEVEPLQPENDVVYSYKATQEEPVQNSKPETGIFIQIGAYKNEKAIDEIQADLPNIKLHNFVKHRKNYNLNCVRTESFKSYEEATFILDKIYQEGYSDAMIIVE